MTNYSSSLYKLLRSSLDRLLSFFDRSFNYLFTSEYNPLYRSGTLAIASMSIASVTGVLLLFFFSVGTPYESVAKMESDNLVGGILRSVHRYSSDLTVVAVLLHLLRMFAQRKSWGKRTLAWISGVVLLGGIVVIAWTGFVLVWDIQAQSVVLALSSMIDATGILSDPIVRAFSGEESEPPDSFFFLVLFIHGALPLGMILGIWIHTAKMARATWFPQRNLFIALVAFLFGASLLLHLPLPEKADLLSIPSTLTLNPYYNLWIPLSEHYSVSVVVGGLAILVLLMSFPFLIKPAKEELPPTSDLDSKKCVGCTQCVIDCPYEAITMVPRTDGLLRLSEMVASVDGDLCVSCGLCSASCPKVTIGPPGRKGSDQYYASKKLIEDIQSRGEDPAGQTIVIGCVNQKHTYSKLERLEADNRNVKFYPVECMGSLHMGTIGHLAYYFKHVVLAACPERNCTNKDAFMLLKDRLSGERIPGLPGRAEPEKVTLLSVGEGEEYNVVNLISGNAKFGAKFGVPSRATKTLLPIAAGFLLTLALAVLSTTRITVPVEYGILRLSWRMTSQAAEVCRKRSAEELSAMPAHMRRPVECDREPLTYRLVTRVNGKTLIDESIIPVGFRKDGPLYVFHDTRLPPGDHEIEVEFHPERVETPEAKRVSHKAVATIRQGMINLLTLSDSQDTLIDKSRSAK